MSLPKIQIPTYETILPSTKQKITFRPFLVKEEKLLLMAMSGSDSTPDYEEIARASKQIIANCILSEDVNLDKLYFYDIEHLMTQLRIKSQGNMLALRFSAVHGSECKICKEERTINIDLNEAKVVSTPDHTNKLQLTDTMGLVMKYPDLSLMGLYEKANSTSKSNLEDMFTIFWKCVDYIYENENLYYAKDSTIEEGIEFLENLNEEQFSKIRHFFETMPMLRQTVNIKCKLCEFETKFEMKGFQNFFV